MKKLLAILFALTMLLQTIPVMHFFSAKAEIFYIAMDEERPAEKSKEVKEEKADEKSFLFGQAHLTTSLFSTNLFGQYPSLILPPPHIEKPLLPPNFCW